MADEKQLEDAREEGRIKGDILEMQRLVRAFMIADETCRNDDTRLLYYIFLQRTGKKQSDMPYEDFKKIGCFETVRRTRQKIQETEPELGPTDPLVIEKRRKRESIFRAVFNSGGTQI